MLDKYPQLYNQGQRAEFVSILLGGDFATIAALFPARYRISGQTFPFFCFLSSPYSILLPLPHSSPQFTYKFLSLTSFSPLLYFIVRSVQWNLTPIYLYTFQIGLV